MKVLSCGYKSQDYVDQDGQLGIFCVSSCHLISRHTVKITFSRNAHFSVKFLSFLTFNIRNCTLPNVTKRVCGTTVRCNIRHSLIMVPNVFQYTVTPSLLVCWTLII